MCVGRLGAEAGRIACVGPYSSTRTDRCDGCSGDSCYCEGYFAGYDTTTSNALCADQTLCQYLCDNVPGCVSIDMHRERDRCFLNYASACDTHEDNAEPEHEYLTGLCQKTLPEDDGRGNKIKRCRSLHVDGDDLHTGGEYIYNHFVNCKDSAFFMANDRRCNRPSGPKPGGRDCVMHAG